VSPERDGEQDFGALLDAFERRQAAASNRTELRIGDRVPARIVGVGEDFALVDLGGKSEGMIPLAELRDAEGRPTAAVGDTVEALVASIDDDAGTVVLRVRGGAGGHGGGAAGAAELAQAHAHGLPVEGTVRAVVKGGVEVTVAGLRGFCPISQLDLRHVADPAVFVGQRLTFRISRYESGRGRGSNLVLSRRALLEEEARARAAEARARIAVGKVVRGTVTSLASFGAFVDLGGIEGLLHVSELGHGRVGHPQEVLAVGQEVEVRVQKIEPARDGSGRERIALSHRALLQDPWQEQAARLRPGIRMTGRVARLEAFGAFVELAPGVDGLLHLSELTTHDGKHAPRHPREALQVGQTLEVKVLEVDFERRRISLAPAAPDDEEPGATPPSSATGFGALGDFFARDKKR
jgi:small subunit ribosomal protein S1